MSDVAVNANTPRIGEAGLALIRAAEGLKLVAYRDTGGVPTIGYGHTKGVRMGHTCTKAVAEQYLRDDVLDAENVIHRHLPRDITEALPAPAWDALVDFVFNLGDQSFKNPDTGSMTGLSRALHAHAWDAVPAQFKRWVYDNGVKLGGLVARREAEAVLWNSARWA